jgi:TrpR-related protein YerC/YecD
MSNDNQKDLDFLFETLANITNKEDLKLLFDDLCTYKEIDSMAQRLRSAQLLSNGSTYEQIIKQTEISSATLSRVNKSLKYGKGYKKLFNQEK